MVYYVSLVIYHDGGRKRVPAHWAILVTPREDKLEGRVYHAIGSPFHGYSPDIKENYNLAATKRRHTLVSLGHIDDAKLSSFDETARSIPTPGKSPSPLDPFAVRNTFAYFVIFLLTN